MTEFGFFDQIASVLHAATGERGLAVRIVTIVVVAGGGHLFVRGVRRLGQALAERRVTRSFQKIRTIGTLLESVAVFFVYFFAVGLVLSELGVSLTAYLASASIVGLAIGFGSQGFVQDVVTGLTLVFSDLFDVGDMVEIAGQSGIVRGLGLRFTVLINGFGAEVYIPNRTIANVVNYPRGYVRCLFDITLPAGRTLRRGSGRRASESQPPMRCERFTHAETTLTSPGIASIRLPLKSAPWRSRGVKAIAATRHIASLPVGGVSSARFAAIGPVLSL